MLSKIKKYIKEEPVLVAIPVILLFFCFISMVRDEHDMKYIPRKEAGMHLRYYKDSVYMMATKIDTVYYNNDEEKRDEPNYRDY